LKIKLLVVLGVILLIAPYAHADVEGSLRGLKDVLFNAILPLFAMMGLGFAAFSFLTGNPNAKNHLAYAITGAVIVFGAQSILDLIRRTVQ
jgi:hypothetical protein